MNIGRCSKRTIFFNLEYLGDFGVVEWLYPIYQDMWVPGELAPGDQLVGVVGARILYTTS